MSPDDYCANKAVQSGSSFYYSFLFLEPERRRAITALYAFCREVDDAVDEPHEASVAQARLAWWRGEIERVFAGRPEHPVGRALSPHLSRFDLPHPLFEEIIDGMAMDLEQSRYASFDTLRIYCHRVAGVVGLLAARVFGFTDQRTLEYAAKLGLAFQLTNIIRDVGEDARRNRIYLPLDELERFAVPVNDLIAARQSERFHRLMAFQVERAERCYDEALAVLPPQDRRAQRPGLVMAAIYRALLREIRRARFDVLSRRTSLTPVRKLWLAWRTWIFART